MKGSMYVIMAAVVLMMGCHAKFKKFARSAKTVDMQVLVVASPRVDLEERSALTPQTPITGAAEAAIGMAAQAEGLKVRRRLERMMEPEAVEAMVRRGAVRNLGDGPPFGTSEKKRTQGTIEIQVVNYGIEQAGGGPVFVVDYAVNAYRAYDNKRVYSNSVHCEDREFFTHDTPLNIAGTAATIRHLKQMSDEDLKFRLEDVMQRCTGVVIAEMRKHAS